MDVQTDTPFLFSVRLDHSLKVIVIESFDGLTLATAKPRGEDTALLLKVRCPFQFNAS